MKKTTFKLLQSQMKKALDRYDEELIKQDLGLKRLKINEMHLSLPSILASILWVQKLQNSSLFTSYTLWNQNRRLFRWTDPYHASSSPCSLKRLKALSYARFCFWFNRCGALLGRIARDALKSPHDSSDSSVLIVDSSLLPINSGKGWTKSLNRKAKTGHGSCSKAFGFKLHVICDAQKNILQFHLSAANLHDLKGLKLLLNQGPQFYPSSKKLLMDRGYLDQALYWDLMNKNLQPVVRPKENMNKREVNDQDFWQNYYHLFQFKYQKIYKIRQRIEHLFKALKGHNGLNLRGAKSMGRVQSIVHSALLLYTLKTPAIF